MSAPQPRPSTRERLLEAAGRVFAARGYRGATMREIAARASANLAAAHYHFGSKQDLYRDVVSSEFERLEQRLAERGGAIDDVVEQQLSRQEQVELLRSRMRVMLETLLEPGSVHATLMQRELADPSEALPFIVRRWIAPLRRDYDRIVARLAPGLGADAIDRCTRSIVGQLFFYLTHREALLLMMKRRAYPPGFVEEVAEHLVEFSLGGLARLEKQERRATPRRREGPA
jgi:TetR/AcrR family transcriptional regulator, regulator of cefoperazone and chloramphenicol sensitivity